MIPHPFPYQGSKRRIAASVLRFVPGDVERLVEPFCGAAALSIALASSHPTCTFLLNDLNGPLMALWQLLLESPQSLADGYARHWQAQQVDPRAYFLSVRERFNSSPEPDALLYLLARIVKGAVRYSQEGAFNQSPDHRRLGMKPETMRHSLEAVHRRMAGRTSLSCLDFREVLEATTPREVVYLDPPYQGTSGGTDRRYWQGIDRQSLIEALESLNARGIPYLLSYDGRTGERAYGRALPDRLELTCEWLDAGPSAQSTLLRRQERTLEALYLSPVLRSRLALTASTDSSG